MILSSLLAALDYPSLEHSYPVPGLFPPRCSSYLLEIPVFRHVVGLSIACLPLFSSHLFSSNLLPPTFYFFSAVCWDDCFIVFVLFCFVFTDNASLCLGHFLLFQSWGSHIMHPVSIQVQSVLPADVVTVHPETWCWMEAWTKEMKGKTGVSPSSKATHHLSTEAVTIDESPIWAKGIGGWKNSKQCRSNGQSNKLLFPHLAETKEQLAAAGCLPVKCCGLVKLI